MKVKPYRICDVCGQEYHKQNGMLKIKIYDQYEDGELFPWKKFDICSNCAAKLIDNISNKVNYSIL